MDVSVRRRLAAFSLIELMTALAVALILMVLLFSMVEQISRVVRRASGGSSAFDAARLAFADMQARLSQATLSPYWKVAYDSSGNPKNYRRNSDLHFLAGPTSELLPDRMTRGGAIFFAAPLGIGRTLREPAGSLNAAGFFVEFRDVNQDSPFVGWKVLPEKRRFQLRAVQQPTEELSIFDPDAETPWWRKAVESAGEILTLGENIPLVIFRLKSFKGTEEVAGYHYDSREWDGTGSQPATSHQLPQAVDILMVAVDASLAERMGKNATPPEICPEELFDDPRKFEEDARALEAFLARTYPQSSFRIFRATVPIRAAKWSLDSTVAP